MKALIKKHISNFGMKTFFRYQWDRVLTDEEIAYISANPFTWCNDTETTITSSKPTDEQLKQLDKEAW